ncbi:response regulator [Flavobacterium sp. NST-5]|uniref:Response regulator n=1 Tax=Flavobacterium ichthyis TaxID=2698827 RepID=A0ABW9ZBP1_9FLAO|nr:response regulator transcription factor [Flavobacterium ichthyis]NBL64737.1 response regulator [Flavobacterium ichthyis]
MIKVCIADNHPVVHFGLKSYFRDRDITILAHVENYDELEEVLANKNIEILILDLELKGLSSINLVKSMKRDYPNLKIVVFTSLSEVMFGPNAVKAGISAFISKTSKMDNLVNAVNKVKTGNQVISEIVRKNLAMMGKKAKNDRLYRKLSSREIEVLRYLSDGKKNKEIAEILDLNEKTVSTYKLRLLAKLNVTNLVDLVNKAKTLEIV